MKKRYEPDEAVKPMYDRLFKTYRATYAHLKEQWRSEG